VTVFVDTSALYALLDEDDANHERAVAIWRALLTDHDLTTHAYVAVETTALVQRRLGFAAADQLHAAILPPVLLVPVDRELHDRAVTRWRSLSQRELSLVDVTSFELMAQGGLDTAFAFDDDFTTAGFTLL
jgi:uncharacterized protein